MIGDLSNIFLTFLYRNMTVAVVIIAVLLARLLLRRMPKKYSYALWSIVGIRMLFDLPIASRLSIFNLFRGIAGRISGTGMTFTGQTPSANITGTLRNTAGNAPVPSNVSADAANTASAIHASGNALTASQTVLGILGLIWLIGIGIFVAYGIYSYIKCRKLVQTAVIANDIRCRVPVWECDRIPSPFVLGFFRPRIYLPFRMPEQEQAYILAHEQYHVRRLDPLWKLIAFLLLAVYWWNPLAWLAFFYMVRDMEMSCDEAVIEQLGNNVKQGYSTSLLSFAMERHPYSFAPVAFGEGDAGRRIKNVLNFKKPQTWVAIIVIVLLVIVAISCLTNGKDNSNTSNTQEPGSEQISTEVLSDTQDTQIQETEVPASTESNTSATYTPSEITVEIPDKVPVKDLIRWALSFCNRDVTNIKEMASEKAQNDLKQQNLLDDNDNFGWSSPWPTAEYNEGESGYLITNVDADNHTVTYLYYAWTSDPHMTVWAETIHYTVKDDTFEVTDEELQMREVISAGSEFDMAYPNGIENTPMDYQTNGLGETLNEHAKSANGMSPDGKYDLTDPIAAARYLLNLLPNDSKVKITADTKGDYVDLTIHFTEDDVTRYVTMERPWGNDGIWVMSNNAVKMMQQ